MVFLREYVVLSSFDDVGEMKQGNGGSGCDTVSALVVESGENMTGQMEVLCQALKDCRLMLRDMEMCKQLDWSFDVMDGEECMRRVEQKYGCSGDSGMDTGQK